MVPSGATVARIHTEGILELLQLSFLDNNVLWFRWTVTVVSMGVVAMETTTCFRGLSFRFRSRWSMVGWAFGLCVHVVTYYLCVCVQERGKQDSAAIQVEVYPLTLTHTPPHALLHTHSSTHTPPHTHST